MRQMTRPCQQLIMCSRIDQLGRCTQQRPERLSEVECLGRSFFGGTQIHDLIFEETHAGCGESRTVISGKWMRADKSRGEVELICSGNDSLLHAANVRDQSNMFCVFLDAPQYLDRRIAMHCDDNRIRVADIFEFRRKPPSDNTLCNCSIQMSGVGIVTSNAHSASGKRARN